MNLLRAILIILTVGLISAITIPLYKRYQNIQTVYLAMPILADLEQAAIKHYQNDPTIGYLNFMGMNLGNDVVTAYNKPPVVNILYVAPNGHEKLQYNQFAVCVYIAGLKFDEYIEPKPDKSGKYARVCKQVTAGPEVFETKCGKLQGSASDIPTDYLPVDCNCANIWGGLC